MLPKPILAAVMALALGVPAGLAATTGLGPLKFSFHPFGGSEESSAMAPLPVWRAGDTWNYTLKGSSQAPMDHVWFRGNLTITVDGVFPKAKSGLPEDVYNLTLTGDLEGRQLVHIDDPELVTPAGPEVVADGRAMGFVGLRATLKGSAMVGTEDLALFREHVNITGAANRGSVSLAFYVDVVNTYTPGLPVLKFPLKVNETWDQNVSLRSVSTATVVIKDPSGMARFSLALDRTFAINRTARVTEFGNATVPAGTFKAFKVVTHRAEEREHEANEARENESEAEDDQPEVGLAVTQDAAESMALHMTPPKGVAVGFLRFSPAEALWYSADVRNVVAFRLHFLGPLGKTKVVGELRSFHVA